MTIYSSTINTELAVLRKQNAKLVAAGAALLDAIAYVPGIEVQRRAFITALAAAEQGA